MITLEFVRHGTTNLNGKGYVATKKDFPLNEKGVETCIQNRFDNGRFDKVYCSPYKRTIQTAQLIYPYKQANISHLITQRDLGVMNERFKYEFDIKYLKQIRDYLVNPPNAESLEDIVNRLNEFFDMIRYENMDESKILVVTHNGIMRIIKKEFMNSESYEDTTNLSSFRLELERKR